MNLEAIAMRRAEEQVAVRGVHLLPDPGLVVTKPRNKGGGRHRTCSCDACPRCKKRALMAAWRERKRAGKPNPPRGPSKSLGRLCQCGRAIANWNKTGFCDACHHEHKTRRIGRTAVARHHFSHGGGI